MLEPVLEYLSIKDVICNRLNMLAKEALILCLGLMMCNPAGISKNATNAHW